MFPVRNDIAANLRASVYVDIFDESILPDIDCARASDFSRQIEIVDECAAQFVCREIVFAACHFKRKINSRDDISFSVDAAQIAYIRTAIFAGDAKRIRAEIKFDSIARR